MHDFENLTEAWSELDVVVISPKVTVGADFSVKHHFDAIFVYGESMSVVPRTLLQMCGRCRHPVSKTIHMYVHQRGGGGGEGGSSQRPTLAMVRDDVTARIQAQGKIESDILDLYAEYKASTRRIELELAPNPITDVYLYNHLERERARADYTDELKRVAVAKEHTVTSIADTMDTDEDTSAAKARHAQQKAATAELFDETPLIDDAEADALELNTASGIASETDKWKMEKYNYTRLFSREPNVDGEHYTTVRKHVPTILQVCVSTRLGSIVDIHKHDMKQYQHAYNELVCDKLLFPKMFAMQKLAQLLRMHCVLDTETVVSCKLLREAGPSIDLLDLHTVFGLRLPSKTVGNDLRRVLGLVNTVFRMWCGGSFKIKSSKRPHNSDSTRERFTEYRLFFPSVLGGRTLLDIADTVSFFMLNVAGSEASTGES